MYCYAQKTCKERILYEVRYRRPAERRQVHSVQRHHLHQERGGSNYPFCTIEPNSGIVAVPDKRLDKLAEVWQTNKKTPAIVEFVDIAGLVKGASQGAGLGNKFLGHIRECDAIVHVVRCFDDDNIIHVSRM